MSDEDRRITRRDFDKAVVVGGASLVLGCHSYQPACRTDVLRADVLDNYQPRFLTERQCLTLAATAEVMIARCPPVISAAEVARRADKLLAATEAPAAKQMQTALDVLETFAGLLSHKLKHFSEMEVDDRRKIIRRFVKDSGIKRDATRPLKLLTVVPYYSHPEVRRAIGFVDFEDRPRYNPLPVYTEPKTHPEPEHFGPRKGAVS